MKVSKFLMLSIIAGANMTNLVQALPQSKTVTFNMPDCTQPIFAKLNVTYSYIFPMQEMVPCGKYCDSVSEKTVMRTIETKDIAILQFSPSQKTASVKIPNNATNLLLQLSPSQALYDSVFLSVILPIDENSFTLSFPKSLYDFKKIMQPINATPGLPGHKNIPTYTGKPRNVIYGVPTRPTEQTSVPPSAK